MELKIKAIGNSSGVILPKELLARLRVEKGDSLFVTETKDGLVLRSYSPEFAKKWAIAEKVMHDQRDLLRRLADS